MTKEEYVEGNEVLRPKELAYILPILICFLKGKPFHAVISVYWGKYKLILA